MGAVPLVQAISQAIAEVSGLVRELVAGKDVARMKYQIEAGQNYVFVDEKSGQFAGISNKEQEKQKIHFRKRLFDSI